LVLILLSGEETDVEVGSDIFDALRTSSPVELRESATRFRPKAAKETLNEQCVMARAVLKRLRDGMDQI